MTPCYTSSVFYSLHPTSFSSSSNLHFVLAFLIYVEYALQLATSPHSGSATIICIYRGVKSDLSSLHCHFNPFFYHGVVRCRFAIKSARRILLFFFCLFPIPDIQWQHLSVEFHWISLSCCNIFINRTLFSFVGIPFTTN